MLGAAGWGMTSTGVTPSGGGPDTPSGAIDLDTTEGSAAPAVGGVRTLNASMAAAATPTTGDNNVDARVPGNITASGDQ